MGVEPKIGGYNTPKWMVKIRENPMNKWDDLGVFPLLLETQKMDLDLGITTSSAQDFFQRRLKDGSIIHDVFTEKPSNLSDPGSCVEI